MTKEMICSTIDWQRADIDCGLSLSIGQFYEWLHQTTRYLDHSGFVDRMEFFMRSATPGTPLVPHRQRSANRLFLLYDPESSGFIEQQVVLSLLATASELTEEDISEGMAAAGEVVTDGKLQRDQFYRWLHILFGSMDKEDYDGTLAELIQIAQVDKVTCS